MYHHTICATPGQSVYGKYIKFNCTSVVDWRVITSRNQIQVNIDNLCKHGKQLIHDWDIGDIVYVDNTSIYLRIYYKKHWPYITTELLIRDTVWFHNIQVNERKYKTVRASLRIKYPLMTLRDPNGLNIFWVSMP